MATMRKMKGGKFYSRITWRKSGKKTEIVIPLKTSSKTEARTRLKSVNNEERDIINGIVQKFQFKDIFRWLNDAGTSRFTSLRLVDIIPEYLKYRKCVVRKGSYERDGYALKQLTRCLGDNKAVQDINYKDIEQVFIPFYKNKGYENGGLNLSMRTLKIFFGYLLKEKLIDEKIEFKMLPKDDTQCYINRAEINALHDAVDEKFRRWFYFYEIVGCRASDPFLGFVDGNVWKISPDEAKTKHWHYYPLTDDLKYIWMELQDLKQSYLDKGKSEERSILMSYNVIRRKLNSTIKSLREKGVIPGGKKLTLKSFRHTFGIVNVVRTKDIWGTSKKMNHKEIGVTQEYLDIEHYIIAQDFPELKPYLVDNDSNLRSEPSPHSDNPLSASTPPVLGGDGNLLMEKKRRFSS